MVEVVDFQQNGIAGRRNGNCVLRLREQDFVIAAQCTGVPAGRILFRHILPHLVGTAIVWGTLGIATNVMLEASLSFLGIGVQPPTPSWGVGSRKAGGWSRSSFSCSYSS